MVSVTVSIMVSVTSPQTVGMPGVSGMPGVLLALGKISMVVVSLP